MRFSPSSPGGVQPGDQSSEHSEANFPRRSLLGAAVAVVTGGAVLAAPATAAAQESTQARTQRSWETDYDHRGKMENPANPLGCPLGKGV